MRKNKIENLSLSATGTNYTIYNNGNEDEKLVCCVWTDGIRILLPQTDHVGFVFQHEGELKAGMATWDEVMESFGHMLQPQGYYPERYLVEELERRIKDDTRYWFDDWRLHSHENGFLLDQNRRQGRIYSCESFGCHYYHRHTDLCYGLAHARKTDPIVYVGFVIDRETRLRNWR